MSTERKNRTYKQQENPMPKGRETKQEGREAEAGSGQDMLLRELRAYEQSGCRLYLNGRESRPRQVVEACMRENHPYMRDIEGDDQDRIRKINFIRITRE